MEKDCEAKPDFVAVDFEHATSEKATICSVGIVLFKDGEIIEKFHSFVQPPENKYELTWLHKIHPRLTENAPSFVEIFPEIYKRLNNNTVVAHGAFHTDKVCLDNAIILHNIEASFHITWVDTQEICNCGLDVACKVCNIELSHHEALSDAIGCGTLYSKYLKSDLPPLSEFQRAKNEEPALSNNINYPKHLTGEVFKPDFENAKNKTNPFYKKKVVLSGFDYIDKERIANELKELGADVDTAVGNNTNFLITGDNPVGPTKSLKMKENIESGKAAQIINFSQYNELKKYQHDAVRISKKVNIDEFKIDIERQVKVCIEELLKNNTSFDSTTETYEIRHNKGYDTILLSNVAVIRVKQSKNKDIRLELAKKYVDLFGLQNDVRYTTSDILWGKLSFNESIAIQIINNIKTVFKQCYADEAVDNFGCCSRYNECSDEKKCTHPDIKLASGCHYKAHLENGRIFYGNNRNVE